MTTKEPIDRQRIRKVPAKFSWVDHRLVRDRHIEYCSHSADALYLFLVTVSDGQGLSYYSDASLMQRLSMDHAALLSSRQNLIRLGLVAYKNPLHQVLALDVPLPSTSPTAGPLSMAKILQQIAGGAG
ncbi:hypothetical protein ACOHYD_10950 [Desulfobacterota bacterium M19]